MAQIVDDFGNVVRPKVDGVRNPNFATGPMSPEAAAWRASQTAAPTVTPKPVNPYTAIADKDVGRAAKDAALRVMPSMPTAAKWAGRAGKATGVVGAAVDAADVLDVATDDSKTGIDVGTEVAGKAGKWGLAGIGALKGGAAGAAFGGPFAPVTGPLGALAGGVAGYFAGDKLIEGGRAMFGSDTRDPSETSNGVVSKALGRNQGVQMPAAPVPSPDDQSAAETARLRRNDSALAAGQAPLGGMQSTTDPRDGPAPTQNDMALRKAERDALTQKEIGMANQMEADRLAKEKANADGNAASLRVAQGIQDRMDQEKARRSADITLGSIASNKFQKAAAAQSLRNMELRDAQRDKLESDSRNWASKNENDLRMAGMKDATDRRGQDVTAAGFRARSASDAARLQYEMGKDRLERQDKNADRREAMIKERFTKTGIDKDGKPYTYFDANGANEFRKSFLDQMTSRGMNPDDFSGSEVMSNQRNVDNRVALRDSVNNALASGVRNAPISNAPLTPGQIGGTREQGFSDIFNRNADTTLGSWLSGNMPWNGSDEDTLVQINRDGTPRYVRQSKLIRNPDGTMNRDAIEEMDNLRRR